jgi:probable rRNA maturation factor
VTSHAFAVEVQNESGSDQVPDPLTIRAWLEAALGAELRGEVTVRLVTESESAELNVRYRGRQGPTNVLAFAADPPAPPLAEELPPAGDLAICPAVLAREATEQRKALQAHWAHVVIHGALHLVGYDHETEPEARAMEHRERELLGALGYPDPYVEN